MACPLGTCPNIPYSDLIFLAYRLCIIFLLHINFAGLELAQTNLIHSPLSILCHLHKKMQQHFPPPSPQKRRKGKGRQRQQGRKGRKKLFQHHMIVPQWVPEAKPLQIIARPHIPEANGKFSQT
jgi:hypothetical protein